MQKPSVAVKKTNGHGGARPGAGRPKSKGVLATPELIQKKAEKELVEEAKAILRETPTGDLVKGPVPTMAELVALAKQALAQIVAQSPEDGPRVSAARLIQAWDKADEDRKAEANGTTGKKAVAKAEAETHAATSGKFAPPPPSSSRFQ